MNKKITNVGRVLRFIREKGFYITLMLCLIIVGATGFIVTKRNLDYYSRDGIIDEEAVEETVVQDIDDTVDSDFKQNGSNENENNKVVNTNINENGNKGINNIENEQEKTNRKLSEDIKVKEDNKLDGKLNQPAKQEKAQDQKPTEQKLSLKPDEVKNVAFVYPVQGKIIVDFAMNNLVYSKTLEQWSTHRGIDIRGDRGVPVKACADGIVEKVYHDPKLGITIVIDHGGGIKSKYSNLSNDSMVKAKQKVLQGDVISGIGDTAIFEIGDEPHLHFEVTKDNENVDPKIFLHN